MNKASKTIITFVILLFLVVPLFTALAQYRIYRPLEHSFLRDEYGVRLGDYLAAAFRVGIYLAAILTVIMLIIGGIQYMTAGGDPGKVGNAKDRIKNAVFGLLLVLASYLIVYTINPDLVNLQYTIQEFDFLAP
jgi:ABC-type dipeptide/oligopeptide/nickel transport system permease subunit